MRRLHVPNWYYCQTAAKCLPKNCHATALLPNCCHAMSRYCQDGVTSLTDAIAHVVVVCASTARAAAIAKMHHRSTSAHRWGRSRTAAAPSVVHVRAWRAYDAPAVGAATERVCGCALIACTIAARAHRRSRAAAGARIACSSPSMRDVRTSSCCLCMTSRALLLSKRCTVATQAHGRRCASSGACGA
jgi:hypothetical protein